jgi:RimJ/RimL family protein N-acetyltransferase
MAPTASRSRQDRRVIAIHLTPLDVQDAKLVVEERRREDWAEGYPTQGDVDVAAWISEGTPPANDGDFPWGPWQVHAVDAGLVVGGAGFHGEPDAEGIVEIGYGIAPEWQGQGIATTAVERLIAIARAAGARRLVAGTDPDNVPSQRVLEKNGFVRLTVVDTELRWSLDLTDPRDPATD